MFSTSLVNCSQIMFAFPLDSKGFVKFIFAQYPWRIENIRFFHLIFSFSNIVTWLYIRLFFREHLENNKSNFLLYLLPAIVQISTDPSADTKCGTVTAAATATTAILGAATASGLPTATICIEPAAGTTLPDNYRSSSVLRCRTLGLSRSRQLDPAGSQQWTEEANYAQRYHWGTATSTGRISSRIWKW